MRKTKRSNIKRSKTKIINRKHNYTGKIPKAPRIHAMLGNTVTINNAALMVARWQPKKWRRTHTAMVYAINYE